MFTDILNRGFRPTAKMRRFAAQTAARRERAAQAIQQAQGIAGRLAIGPMVEQSQPASTAPTTNARGVPFTLPSGLEAVKHARAQAAASTTKVSRAQAVIEQSERAWDEMFEREVADSGPKREVEFATAADADTARELAEAVRETHGSERYRYLGQLRSHVRSALESGAARINDTVRTLRPTPRQVTELMRARDAGDARGMQLITKQIESGEQP